MFQTIGAAFIPGPDDELVGGLDDPYVTVAVECPSVGATTVAVAFYDGSPFVVPEWEDPPLHVSRLTPAQARELAGALMAAVDYAEAES
jgi:hypothetical protein